jgi:unsaturated rhamnogalacturonyl hydrolase
MDRQRIISLINKVADKMKNLENNAFEEKYPIGLIDINLWEWPQGVGLYGLLKYYGETKDEDTLNFLIKWYDERLKEGILERNVNTTSPMLSLIDLYKITKKENYKELCLDWSNWIDKEMLRTGDGTFQHMITGDPNDGQMLIDTLFMTVLFYAKAGVFFDKPKYIEEAKRQILVHIKYLYDKSCGLFYHGWDFNNKNNYGAVHWARGNSWYTCGIVDLLDIMPVEDGLKQYCLDTFTAQVDALVKLQTEEGMWYTVLDNPNSYVETSATAAFAYGILKGVRKGYLDKKYLSSGLKALEAVIDRIDEDGTVTEVSYGTPVGNDEEFYMNIPICPMTYGQALTLLLLTEALHYKECNQ